MEVPIFSQGGMKARCSGYWERVDGIFKKRLFNAIFAADFERRTSFFDEKSVAQALKSLT
jgi:hypothetical protein